MDQAGGEPENLWLHRFAVFTASCTTFLIFAGGLVTSTETATGEEGHVVQGNGLLLGAFRLRRGYAAVLALVPDFFVFVIFAFFFCVGFLHRTWTSFCSNCSAWYVLSAQSMKASQSPFTSRQRS